MQLRKIFLASSFELKDDRKEFEILISRKNKDWIGRGAFLELVVWEDFLDAVAKTRLQDEYNNAIRECDVFVMLFSTKVGQYTEEEFENAFGQFRATNRPLIFTYFKDAQISIGSVNKEDLTSLWSFQERLKALGHYYTVFRNSDELKFHFNQQLDKLAAKGFIEPRLDKDAAALGGNGSDLNFSPLSAPRRLTALDGHPVLFPPGGPSPLYTGGLHVSLTLAHNGEGKQSINLHAMELEVVRFTPGVRPEYAYRIAGAEVIGAGVARPHVFSVVLFGSSVAPAQWVTDAKRGLFVESKSTNFFDTDDPRILTFAAGGADIEEIRGTVFAQDQGLYALRFVFHYSVAGVDRHKETEVVHVYADE